VILHDYSSYPIFFVCSLQSNAYRALIVALFQDVPKAVVRPLRSFKVASLVLVVLCCLPLSIRDWLFTALIGADFAPGRGVLLFGNRLVFLLFA